MQNALQTMLLQIPSTVNFCYLAFSADNALTYLWSSASRSPSGKCPYVVHNVNIFIDWMHPIHVPTAQLGIERVQALADISRSALCCHSNETDCKYAQ